ncbi:Aste57867_8670 [Aphanomyces stellatus]|uniref:Aste57867_8670 protein n=1 Tax=Aphanomyces stellatus TaxID=120398 RepID=A0A485KKY4_9STRA|nr:hypothetical protein As57867_008636 [Aphanomyces stellatus]VFT85556.1 Aste57867_8670 [Aphanomyces stellatus]
MSSSSQPPANEPKTASEPMLALPATSDAGPVLTVGGNSLALDHLGPIVVQTDGSLMRISDWEGKTEHEKAMISRVIAKRNKERLDALQAAANAEMD